MRLLPLVFLLASFFVPARRGGALPGGPGGLGASGALGGTRARGGCLLKGGFNAFFPPVAGGGAQRAPKCAGGALRRACGDFPHPQKSSAGENLEKIDESRASTKIDENSTKVECRRKSAKSNKNRTSTKINEKSTRVK